MGLPDRALTSPRSPLIEADELYGLSGQDGVRIADVRWYLGRPGDGRAAYDEGHIPGAVFVDLDSDLSDHDGYGSPGRHPLPAPHDFARRMGEVGFGSNDLIVAYDDSGGAIAARLWWMLDSLRHKGGVAVLDGGIQAWKAAGFGIETDAPTPAPARIDLSGEWHNVVARDELAARLGALSLIDARAPERYRGEVEPVDPVPGHIPTAVNLPLTGNLDGGGRFKSAEALRVAYGEASRPGVDTVLSCGSGTTACHGILAMRLAGLPEPLLYVGSFSDWSRSGLPVATGPEPGARSEAAAAR
jgi:thiosulfate/3-mercaptopyruvate sulfurtransferase